MYHYVRPISGSKNPAIKGLELDGFKRQLDYLETNYNLISAEDLILSVKEGRDLPSNPCLLTFDDGYKDHILYVFPELVKRKIKACFFPPVSPIVDREILDVNKIHFLLSQQQDSRVLIDNIQVLYNQLVEENYREKGVVESFENFWQQYAVSSKYDNKETVFIKSILQYGLKETQRKEILDILFRRYVSDDQKSFASELYMSMDDVRQLVDSGMYVGSHGYRHVWLDKESKVLQAEEIDLSIRFLSDVGAATDDWIMCYPYGGYNEETLAILKNRNCLIGLTTRTGVAELETESLLELARFDTNDFPQ